MNNRGMIIFLIIDSIILLTLLVAKTALFLKAARKKTLRRWFYFNTYDIEDAPSDNIKMLRKRHNVFTTVILVTIILSAIIAFFIAAAE